MDDGPPEDLPPLGARTAAVLTVWAVIACVLHLAVRELGLRLLP